MQDHPHKFIKPFNGIDAIGRWMVLVSLCAAAFIFIESGEITRVLGIDSSSRWIPYIAVMTGVMVLFSCGLGLCLRIRLCYYASLVLGPAFLAAITFIASILKPWDSGRGFLVFLTICMAAWTSLLAAVAYFLSQSVRREFLPDENSQDGLCERPHRPAVYGVLFFGVGYLAVGVILCEPIFDYFPVAIERLFAFSRRAMSDGLAFVTFTIGLYAGSLVVVASIFLMYREKFGRVSMVWLGLLYTVLPAVTLCGIAAEVTILGDVYFRIWFSSISIPASYLGWSVFRYMRSEPARKTFNK